VLKRRQSLLARAKRDEHDERNTNKTTKVSTRVVSTSELTSSMFPFLFFLFSFAFVRLSEMVVVVAVRGFSFVPM
jgi:hypothetical protein